MPDKQIVIRRGTLSDIPDLVALELQCFDHDIINRRQFRHMLKRANCDLLVVEENNRVVAYVLVLYNWKTKIARLYSIAVAEQVRKKGLGQQLVQAAEKSARRRFCNRIRLEIRKDNLKSINLFQSLGYHQFGEHSAYYPDHMDAVRMEKRLHLATQVEQDINTDNTDHSATDELNRYTAG